MDLKKCHDEKGMRWKSAAALATVKGTNDQKPLMTAKSGR